jgi:hemerythrin-like metal-binding protein
MTRRSAQFEEDDMNRNGLVRTLRDRNRAQERRRAVFLAHMRAVAERLERGASKKSVLKKLNELYTGISHLFYTEERYMDSSAYPAAQAHRRLHRDFMDDFLDIAFKVSNGASGSGIAAEFREKISDRFEEHENGNDVMLMPYAGAATADFDQVRYT